MLDPIVYVLPSAGLSGGARVVFEQVSLLMQAGHDVTVYYINHSPIWLNKFINCQAFNDLQSMLQALKAFKGIKVATWWETALWVNECLNVGDRGYYLVQDIEESYYLTQEHKDQVLLSYTLGLTPITVSSWPDQQLRQRFKLQPYNVGIGLDHNLYKEYKDVKRDKNRVLTQARRFTVGPNLKGWDTACNAINELSKFGIKKLKCTTFSLEPKPNEIPKSIQHVHYTGKTDDFIAKLYSECGVFLMSSNHEGFCLPALEAMAGGALVATTNADGNLEYCVDGHNCLMCDKGDYKSLADNTYKLIADYDKYANKFIQAGKDTAAKYKWSNVLDKLVDVYSKKAGTTTTYSKMAADLKMSTSDPDKLEYPRVRVIELFSNKLPTLSVIIPTVNDYTKVDGVLTSLLNTLGTDAFFDNYNILVNVVDDGTKNTETLRQLRKVLKKHEELFIGVFKSRFILNKLFKNSNLGYSATVNAGLQYSCNYALLLNNDVKLAQNCVKNLVKTLINNHEAGIVGTKLLFDNGNIQHAGVYKANDSLKFYHHIVDHNKNVNTYCWSVTGAVALIRYEMVTQLGGLSTAYGTAYEDCDYCLNAWLNGYSVIYCSEAIAYHGEGKTRGATDFEKAMRPLMWRCRELAGEQYFKIKWNKLKYINDLKQYTEMAKQAANIEVINEP